LNGAYDGSMRKLTLDDLIGEPSKDVVIEDIGRILEFTAMLFSHRCMPSLWCPIRIVGTHQDGDLPGCKRTFVVAYFAGRHWHYVPSTNGNVPGPGGVSHEDFRAYRELFASFMGSKFLAPPPQAAS